MLTDILSQSKQANTDTDAMCHVSVILNHFNNYTWLKTHFLSYSKRSYQNKNKQNKTNLSPKYTHTLMKKEPTFQIFKQL